MPASVLRLTFIVSVPEPMSERISSHFSAVASTVFGVLHRSNVTWPPPKSLPLGAVILCLSGQSPFSAEADPGGTSSDGSLPQPVRSAANAAQLARPVLSRAVRFNCSPRTKEVRFAPSEWLLYPTSLKKKRPDIDKNNF